MAAIWTAPLLAAAVVIPFFWMVLSLLWPGRARIGLTAVGAILQLSVTILLWWQVRTYGGILYVPGGWPLPLGIALHLDGLALCFLVLTAVIASTCALHAHLYLRDRYAFQRYFWPLYWFLWAGLNSVWLSADVFNLYVSLELVGLCAVGLVAITGEPQALSAALRYLLAALAGSLMYLLGVALLYGGYGTLVLPELAEQVAPGLTTAVALGLMTVGLVFKTALFPLHGWLPPAHGGALPPVSALLSALVIKASFYTLVRLWLDLGDALPTALSANALGLLGAIAIFWGSWAALRQHKLKLVVAYSTVAQIGYFFLLFPLLAGAGVEAARKAEEGVMLLVLAHGLAKAGMFLAAGNLVVSLGRDSVAGLTGISRFRPISLFSFGLAGVTLMGLPPSGGFTAKWLLLQSALASGKAVWAAVILLGGLATAAYIFRVFRQSFEEGPEDDVFNHPSRWMEAVPMSLSLGSVLLGLWAAEPLRLFAIVAEGGSP